MVLYNPKDTPLVYRGKHRGFKDHEFIMLRECKNLTIEGLIKICPNISNFTDREKESLSRYISAQDDRNINVVLRIAPSEFGTGTAQFYKLYSNLEDKPIPKVVYV